MTIDDTQFHRLADKTIDDLFQAIDDQLGDDIEAELQDGILTLKMPSGGQYIVNKNSPLRQIWLSSPQSGAWHFNWVPAAGHWRSTRGSEVLTDILKSELVSVGSLNLGL